MMGNALTYGYSNARIRFLKSQLVGRDRIREMVNASSIEEVVGVLSDTVYSEDLVELSLLYGKAKLVEFATGRHFSEVCNKVLNMTNNESRGVVKAILGRWDAHNIKMILLGKHLGHGADEIMRWLVFAGNLSRAEIEGLVGQNSVAEAVNYMKSSAYGIGLMDCLEEYGKSGDIDPLLMSLDSMYLKELSGSMTTVPDRRVKTIIASEIDARNIMTILRCKKDGSVEDERIKRLLVAGGNLGGREIAELVLSKDCEEVVLKVKRYDLADALERYRVDSSLAHFEVSLERHVVDYALKTFYTSVLSLGVIVGFLYLKGEEVKNIRKIVRGKDFNVPPQALEDVIVYGTL